MELSTQSRSLINILLIISLMFCQSAHSQLTVKEMDSLRANVSRIAGSINARVGVCITQPGSSDSAILYRGDERFPMLSVYKFPIAIAVLKEMDRGNLWMEKYAPYSRDSIFTREEEVYTEANFPGGKVTVGQLLTLMLVRGSNTACDQLLALLKGPANLQNYLRELNVVDMGINATEREVQTDSLRRYDNWTTPVEMNRLLSIAFTESYLTTKNHDFLWDKMAETLTGADRIKGLLPRDIRVAHRTGTGFGSYNDVGIIFLPNGKHLVISVFIAEAVDAPQRCSEAIARIAKLAWDYYSRH
ncbi:class A beta-lactamase [Terrimonas sp. NA20]|uniref:beta-lactamase n=1 Tax=Terrimonas ginsenosidimutans TaxID=2908004 RepID=A0ABS9KKJ4_9BACT|nr:class A beta-lactamase [Terrimonas ginsenosidimutans]MCG2612841.1 class A beta-lactamase [Terrimonas ginsenosidimutans]